MTTEFYDRHDDQNPANGTAINDRNHLLGIIDSFAERPPFFCELVGENGCNLLLGVGGPIGCAQFSRQDGSTPYLMATTSASKGKNEAVDFLIGDTPTPVPGRYCLPFALVREIAFYFQETGGRNPIVDWEQI